MKYKQSEPPFYANEYLATAYYLYESDQFGFW